MDGHFMDLGARNQSPKVQSKTTNSQGKLLIFDRDHIRTTKLKLVSGFRHLPQRLLLISVSLCKEAIGF